MTDSNLSSIERARIEELLTFQKRIELLQNELEACMSNPVSENAPQEFRLRSEPSVAGLSLVASFVQVASQEFWQDHGYKPVFASAMIADDEAIRSSSLHQIKSLLTYCVRGERFSHGHWMEMIRSGKVAAILDRLALLRDAAG